MLSPYPTHRDQLDIEGLQVQLQRVTDPGKLLDRLVSLGDNHRDVVDERLPYWADLWPSAVGLGRYLVDRNIVRPGTTVTELGCGLGLSGIVAGMLGGDLTFTDYLDEALRFARYNWSLNATRPARFVNMDWRQPDPDLAADIILAADLAYDQRLAADLPRAFRCLCNPGGMILISEPNRVKSRAFFTALPKQGFAIEKTVVEGVFEGLSYRASVYRLEWQ